MAGLDVDEPVLQHLHQVNHTLGTCGCGHPKQAWDVIHRLLKMFGTKEFGYDTEIAAIVGPDLGVAQIVLSFLDEGGLIEHGSTIWGSWLTRKGEWTLWALNRSGFDGDAVTEAGLPHPIDRAPWVEPCTDACWTVPSE